jgi:hypothetical protein
VIFRIHGEGVLLAYWERNEEPEREEVDRVWRERERRLRKGTLSAPRWRKRETKRVESSGGI